MRARICRPGSVVNNSWPKVFTCEQISPQVPGWRLRQGVRRLALRLGAPSLGATGRSDPAEHAGHASLEAPPLVDPLFEGHATGLLEVIVLSGRALGGRLKPAFNQPHPLQASQDRVDAALADQFESPAAQLFHQLVSISGFLGDEGQQQHVQDALQQLGGTAGAAAVGLFDVVGAVDGWHWHRSWQSWLQRVATHGARRRGRVGSSQMARAVTSRQRTITNASWGRVQRTRTILDRNGIRPAMTVAPSVAMTTSAQ